MKELDLYLRAKHDLSNQLQLLSIYCELEDYSKVQSVVRDWSEQLQREQLFIQLSWPQFVNTVVHHKLTTDLSLISRLKRQVTVRRMHGCPPSLQPG